VKTATTESEIQSIMISYSRRSLWLATAVQTCYKHSILTECRVVCVWE